MSYRGLNISTLADTGPARNETVAVRRATARLTRCYLALSHVPVKLQVAGPSLSVDYMRLNNPCC